MDVALNLTYPLWVVGSKAGMTGTNVSFVSAEAKGEKFFFVFSTEERARAFASRNGLQSPALMPIENDRRFLALITDLEQSKYTTIFFDHDPDAATFNSSPIAQVKNEITIRLPA